MAASWTLVRSPKHAEKMLIQLITPTEPSWPAVDWTEDTDLSGEAGSMSWLILRTNGAFLWRLMMASACEDEDRAESLLSSSVERAEAAVLSVDTADTEAGCWLATWEGEATLVTSDRVRPQCEAAGPRNLGS